jgi:hypothetical protein
MTWRGLAILLVACSSSPAPKPAPAPPAPAPRVAVDDPACRPPEPPDPPEPEAEGWHRRHVPPPHDACTVDATNTTAEAQAILAPHAPARALPRSTWDHEAAPARLEPIRRRFALAAPEVERLYRTGVVVPARLAQPSYAYAFHEIFQSQLPVYISVDAIFHAVFASHDAIVGALERSVLAPSLADALARMHCALPAAAADYPDATVRDLDLYLTVARGLLTDDKVTSILGDRAVDAEAEALIARITDARAAATIELFGRPRVVDFTQFAPRGHYVEVEYNGKELERYFRAAMWASRTELNLASRSSRSSAPGPEPDPRETPREAIDALALADLVTRSSAAAPLDRVVRAWTALAGRREDVTLDQLAELRRTAGITSLRDPQAFAQLRRALGDRFQRTTRIHPMPEGSTTLPAIATLIGPRIVADATALMPLVHGAVPTRNTVHVADVAYSLGLDRARPYLAADLARFPTLAAQLDVARKLAHDAPASGDLYAAWLAAIRALAEPAPGALPAYLTGDAGADLRLNSIAAAYGQLKHNYALMAGQTYSEFGCAIPDGYVEPAPAAYAALRAYAERGQALAAELDPKAESGAAAYYGRLASTLRVLHQIAVDELANRPLSTDEKRWLGMVAELSVDKSENTTGYPPVYAGWYFDLFPEAERDGMKRADFIADYFTSAEEGIAYVGATAPRLAVIVVDTGGGPRAFVGPVARAYETHTPLGPRLTDETAARLTAVDEPWAASYTTGAPAPAAPRLEVHLDRQTGTLTLRSPTALGKATIQTLDHHRVALATRTVELAAGDTTLQVAHIRQVGALYLQIGAWRDWALPDSYDEINERWSQPPDAE